MRLVLCALAVGFAAPAVAQSGSTYPGPPTRPVEAAPPPSIEVAQASLDAYVADRFDSYTIELLTGARVEAVGPCREDVCRLSLTLANGEPQIIRVQRNARRPGWVIENHAIPLR